MRADSVGTNMTSDSYNCHPYCDTSSFPLNHADHRSEAHESSRYACNECEMSFAVEEQLECHTFAHYLTQTTEYGCTSCLKLFSKPDELQKHLMDIHAHHLYRCSLCKHMFDSKVNIVR